jgi:hypothetical protein
LQYRNDPSTRDITLKRGGNKKKYDRISIWNGITGVRILTYRLNASNATIRNGHYEEELDVGFGRSVSEFPNCAIANIR